VAGLMGSDQPTYDLSWIRYKLSVGRYRIERPAMKGAAALGFDERDILSCVKALTSADFHKSMESETRPGLWQDVYKPTYEGADIYLKLQIDGAADAIVIQFKQR
jgi:motility quorum-sensing regulator / GCU-specific mRNA interferase toxin